MTDTISLLIPWVACLYLLLFIYSKNTLNRNIVISFYLFFSLMGVMAYATYLWSYGSTFAPFNDDTYYYNNIINLLRFTKDYSVNYTAFEYLISFLSLPFHFFIQIDHYDLLPVNWFLGAIFVVESVRFASLCIPTSGSSSKWIGACLVAFNYSCIDGIVHLYRDPLMCVCFVLSLINVYKRKYIYSSAFSFVTLFVRGANGIIAFIYLLLSKVGVYGKLNKTNFIIIIITSILAFPIADKYLNYNRLGRFSSSDIDYESSISDRIDRFKQVNGTGGVLKLLDSSNTFVKALAVPSYMIAPVQVKDIVSNNSGIFGNIARLRIESLWELLHVFTFSLFLSQLFLGLYYCYFNSKGENLLVLLLFLLILISVTFISMQTRHKMAFVLFYPFLYNFYFNYSSFYAKKAVKIFNFSFAIILLFYNIFI